MIYFLYYCRGLVALGDLYLSIEQPLGHRSVRTKVLEDARNPSQAEYVHTRLTLLTGVLINIYAATDSTNTRVIWWNIFEAVALLGMSVFQIYYLKR